MFAVAAWMGGAAPAQQNPFSMALSVNGAPISHFEIDQRERMLRVLGTRGNLREQAISALIDDRIYLQEADVLGINVNESDIRAGMEEFASRGNISAERMVADFRRFGIEEATFRDFVRAGLAWREVVDARFGPRTEEIGPQDIHQAVELEAKPSSTSVLLSEIAISFAPEFRRQALDFANEIYRTVRSKSEFERIARTHSASPSRNNGGDIGWLPLAGLPPAARNAVQVAPTGRTVRPVEMNQVVYVFFKRGTRQESPQAPVQAIEYATLRLASSTLAAAMSIADEIKSRVDTCRDLLSESRNWPERAYSHQTVPIAEVDGEHAIYLATLDNGELKTTIPFGKSEATVELLMLCERKTVQNSELARSTLIGLRSRHLESYARNYLANLRGSAIIRR